MSNHLSHTEYVESLQTLLAVDAKEQKALKQLAQEIAANTASDVNATKEQEADFTACRREITDTDAALTSIYQTLGIARPSHSEPQHSFADIRVISRRTQETQLWCSDTATTAASLQRTLIRLERAAGQPKPVAPPPIHIVPKPVTTPATRSTSTLAIVSAATIVVILIVLVLVLAL